MYEPIQVTTVHTTVQKANEVGRIQLGTRCYSQGDGYQGKLHVWCYIQFRFLLHRIEHWVESGYGTSNNIIIHTPTVYTMQCTVDWFLNRHRTGWRIVVPCFISHSRQIYRTCNLNCCFMYISKPLCLKCFFFQVQVIAIWECLKNKNVKEFGCKVVW